MQTTALFVRQRATAHFQYLTYFTHARGHQVHFQRQWTCFRIHSSTVDQHLEENDFDSSAREWVVQ